MDIFGDEFSVSTPTANPVTINDQAGASSSGLDDFLSADETNSLGKDKQLVPDKVSLPLMLHSNS